MAEFVATSRSPATPDAVMAVICDTSQWSLFPGYGPLPAITRAEVVGGGPVGLGARIRVENSDGSVHHEVVRAFEPGRHIHLHMEITPPAAWFMASIDEYVDLAPDGEGTRISRRFVAPPRAWYTTPFAWWFGGFLLSRAVAAHDAKVAVAYASR